jgi:hypothetical protein
MKTLSCICTPALQHIEGVWGNAVLAKGQRERKLRVCNERHVDCLISITWIRCLFSGEIIRGVRC